MTTSDLIRRAWDAAGINTIYDGDGVAAERAAVIAAQIAAGDLADLKAHYRHGADGPDSCDRCRLARADLDPDGDEMRADRNAWRAAARAAEQTVENVVALLATWRHAATHLTHLMGTREAERIRVCVEQLDAALGGSIDSRPRVVPADLGRLDVEDLTAYAAALSAELDKVLRAIRARWSEGFHVTGRCWCKRTHDTAADAMEANRGQV